MAQHTGHWSLVNRVALNAYKTLYKGHMNINEMASRPWGWHWPLCWSVYQRDTPTGMVYSLVSRTSQRIWAWCTHWFPGLVSGYGHGILTGFQGWSVGMDMVYSLVLLGMDMVYSLFSKAGQRTWTWYTHSFPGLVSGYGHGILTHFQDWSVDMDIVGILTGFQDWSVDMGIIYSLVSRTGQWTWALYTHWFPGLVSGHGHCILTTFQDWSVDMGIVYSLVSRAGQKVWIWYTHWFSGLVSGHGHGMQSLAVPCLASP